MLRRVAPTVRVLLFVIGLALLLWLPVSYYSMIRTYSPWPRACGLSSTHGAAYFYCHVELPLPPGVTVTRRMPDPSFPIVNFVATRDFRDFEPWLIARDAWVPRYNVLPVWNRAVLRIPLWLLAAACLAWPVTSFLVRRRRRGRGFEVETKAAGDPAADPPDDAGGRG